MYTLSVRPNTGPAWMMNPFKISYHGIARMLPHRPPQTWIPPRLSRNLKSSSSGRNPERSSQPASLPVAE